MKLLEIHSGPFHRFGSRYGSLFDSSHLLGRGIFDDTWLVKKKSDQLKTTVANKKMKRKVKGV
ncbi:MAG: hypothetical protein RLO81_03900 [Fulvivirga sp.]|uniref:hypothetical protein n=1 Tax=Fulvivirga sp. TaxID=1931237 RepID=UPI0032EAB5ED